MTASMMLMSAARAIAVVLGRADSFARTGSFNQAIGTPTDAGSAWVSTGSGGSNQVYMEATDWVECNAFQAARCALLCASANGTISGYLRMITGNSGGILFRGNSGDTGLDTCWMFIHDSTGTSQFRLIKRNGGTESEPYTAVTTGASFTSDSIHLFEVVLAGNAILCKYDGVTIFNITGESFQAAGTMHGFALNGDRYQMVGPLWSFSPTGRSFGWKFVP